ncbi:MAG TPA: metabolite traffic protein EboE [Kiritimatiellia bacterium]|nr:metabolite traffic protein EboE [Kiritimatiellia bacterium]
MIDASSHLTYCLNIHPGESWVEQEAAIRRHACAVRDRVAGGRPFGLGLRLSAASVRTLSEPAVLAAFRALLDREGLYAFTINGFPYGAFHATRVKEAVYRPDWRTAERLAYTCQMADVLAALLPDGVEGSISTVPVGFGADFADAAARAQAADRLVDAARHLAAIEARTGRLLHLGLEPEPACVLETCDDALGFFALLQDRAGRDAELVRRHVGICFDTCHVALAFEELATTWRRYRAAGIRISKVQLSAALEVRGPAPAALAAFVEPVYLHQVRMRRRGGAAAAWLDLPDALAAWPDDADTTRVHFHVPLFWSGDGALQPTTHTLDDPFRACLRDGSCAHQEIETYTFDVLPPELRAGGVVDSICSEYRWVAAALLPPEGDQHACQS